MNSHPPKLPHRFLRWYCHPGLLPYIEGDLLELYEENVKTRGAAKARWLFARDVLKLFRPGIIRSWGSGYQITPYGMFKNYFKVAWRNLVRQKLYSTINILGLSVGIMSFMILLIYVHYEYSFDAFYRDSDQIYRVYQQQENNEFNGSNFFAVTPAQLAHTLEQEFPEVAAATSFNTPGLYLEDANRNHFLQKGLFADVAFFKVFEPEFLIGNSESAFSNPNSMVITRSLAIKIFGEKYPLGEQLTAWGRSYQVTGVIEDFPENSSLEVTFIANLMSSEGYVRDLSQEVWQSNSYHTFFKVHPGVDIPSLQVKLQHIAEQRWTSQDKNAVHYFIQPLAELHLNSGVNWDPGIRGNAAQIRLFSVVAFLILILVGINYTNLALARSIRRSKEVGLRKVIGAVRSQVTFQFLAESFLYSWVALLCAIVALCFLLPMFGRYVDRPLGIDLIFNPSILSVVLAMVFMTGLLSGFYPAVFVSAMKPINVLKGKLKDRSPNAHFQRILIITQYAVSSGMIICCLVIFQQFQFIQKKDPGFSRENVITVQLKGNLASAIPTIKNDWNELPQVKGIAASEDLPIDVSGSNVAQDDEGNEYILYRLRADDQFLNVFRISLASGRFFSEEYVTDKSGAILLNERAVAELGWTNETAIGRKIKIGEEKTIIGVVRDFHMQSLHLPIAPLYFELTEHFNYLSVRVDSDDLDGVINALHAEMDKHSDYSLEFELLDDQFLKMYSSEMNEGKIFGFFTLVALMIAAIGLFGMAALAVERRIKEIGIRKVMGASVQSILTLLTKDFLELVFLGCVAAIPLALLYLSGWLEKYAYHISIDAWMVFMPCAGALLIAATTVAYQAFKAARVNPINCLRDE